LIAANKSRRVSRRKTGVDNRNTRQYQSSRTNTGVRLIRCTYAFEHVFRVSAPAVSGAAHRESAHMTVSSSQTSERNPPATGCGVVIPSGFIPVPSCPALLNPSNKPFHPSQSACERPATNERRAGRPQQGLKNQAPTTGVGALRAVVVPSPSCPDAFSPNSMLPQMQRCRRRGRLPFAVS